MRDTPYSSLENQIEHRPLYAIVAQRLTEEIAGGAFFDQDKLPSEEKLGRMFGVSRATIREALSVLESRADPPGTGIGSSPTRRKSRLAAD